MNKCTVRFLGIFVLLAFMLLMLNLQKQLLMLQRARNPQPATTTSR